MSLVFSRRHLGHLTSFLELWFASQQSFIRASHLYLEVPPEIAEIGFTDGFAKLAVSALEEGVIGNETNSPSQDQSEERSDGNKEARDEVWTEPESRPNTKDDNSKNEGQEDEDPRQTKMNPRLDLKQSARAATMEIIVLRVRKETPTPNTLLKMGMRKR
ncbi:hypothetical protein B0J14DRAFT_686019 [Halenospora varia]|nr:hypothetical protein B0J14DRAFT_686019 [Halenospora varia]